MFRRGYCQPGSRRCPTIAAGFRESRPHSVIKGSVSGVSPASFLVQIITYFLKQLIVDALQHHWQILCSSQYHRKQTIIMQNLIPSGKHFEWRGHSYAHHQHPTPHPGQWQECFRSTQTWSRLLCFFVVSDSESLFLCKYYTSKTSSGETGTRGGRRSFEQLYLDIRIDVQADLLTILFFAL